MRFARFALDENVSSFTTRSSGGTVSIFFFFLLNQGTVLISYESAFLMADSYLNTEAVCVRTAALATGL